MCWVGEEEKVSDTQLEVNLFITLGFGQVPSCEQLTNQPRFEPAANSKPEEEDELLCRSFRGLCAVSHPRVELLDALLAGLWIEEGCC